MKKAVYVASFALFGFFLQLIIHGFIEMRAIQLLTHDYETYGLGLSWSTWFMIHHVLSLIVLILGVTLGIKQGFYWWRILYIERKKASPSF